MTWGPPKVLPSGWTENTSSNGDPYYYHKESAKIQFEHPDIANGVYSPRPPRWTKAELLAGQDFSYIDKMGCDSYEHLNMSTLVDYFCLVAKTDLQKVRIIYRWITHNIRYIPRYMNQNQSAEAVYKNRGGVCVGYSHLFCAMCAKAGIRANYIRGFTMPKTNKESIRQSKDPTHAWSAVFLEGYWWLVDATWGSGDIDDNEQFNFRYKEHWFLTDPDKMIFTHFPWTNDQTNYNRWQLLKTPITIGRFINQPRITTSFWNYGLEILQYKFSPVSFKQRIEVKLKATKDVSYSYELYNEAGLSMNRWVFFEMTDDNTVASFVVSGRKEEKYTLKVFAKLSSQETAAVFDEVVNFLLVCSQKLLNAKPWPKNSQIQWGLTKKMQKCGLTPKNFKASNNIPGMNGLMILKKTMPVDVVVHAYDANGEMVLDMNMVKTTDKEEELELIVSPPRPGRYKLEIYGKPKAEPGNSLPYLASFAIEKQYTGYR